MPEGVLRENALADVLVIDDNKQLAELLSEQFEKRGLSARCAFTGEGSVEVIKDLQAGGRAPAIILLDVIMPGLSGVDLMKRIKRSIPEVRFMLMSGYNAIPEIDEMSAEGIVELFYKPFKINEVTDKIEFILSNVKRVPVS